MAQVKDVVCGMTVDTETAPAKTEYKGKTYYFCSQGCRVAFARDPEKYIRAQSEPHQGHPSHGHCC